MTVAAALGIILPGGPNLGIHHVGAFEKLSLPRRVFRGFGTSRLSKAF
jgi:hypothetical protein